MAVVDLSLDCSFFVRALPGWVESPIPESAPETMPLVDELWRMRYEAHTAPPLRELVDPSAHADVVPWKMIRVLEHAGVTFQHVRSAAVGDRAVHALEYLKPKRAIPDRVAPDILLHLSAYHGCAGGSDRPQSVRSDNWMQHYLGLRSGVRVLWVEPKHAREQRVWMEPDYVFGTERPIHTSWESLLKGTHGRIQNWEVRRVYLSLNSAHTPPHLDHLFLDLVRDVAERVYQNSKTHDKKAVTVFDNIRARKAPAATLAAEGA